MSAAASSAGRSSYAARRRQAQRAALLQGLSGILLLALIAGTVVYIIAAFRGTFSTYVSIQAALPPGNPVTDGVPVDFRQVQVGQVGKLGRHLPGGAIQVELHIKPHDAKAIPANVTVSVAPSSVFGINAVELTSAPKPTGHLMAGQPILVAASSGSASLQTGLTNINTLLINLHPDQINDVLGTVAQALQGQGPGIGTAIDQLNSYLKGIDPDLPTLESDIQLLTPVLNGLSQSVPALLDLASNASTTAQTITAEQGQIAQVLRQGTTVAGQTTTLLNDVGGELHTVLTNLFPLLIDVQSSPSNIAQIITDLDAFARKATPVFQGSHVNVNANFYVSNPEDALVAASFLVPTDLSQRLAYNAFEAIMDPPTYSSLNCPRYGGQAGPNCARPATTAATTGATSATPAAVPPATKAAGSPTTNAATTGSPATAPTITPGQAASASSVASHLSGGSSDPQASVVGTVLAPLLQSLLGGSGP